MGNWRRATVLLALGLASLSACSNDEESDPFKGIVPAAGGTRPLQSLDLNSASATGIWRIDGERSASPYNVTEIWCWRPDMTCQVASAELINFAGTKMLSVSRAGYDVDSWNENELVFSSSGGCRTATFKLSRKDGSVVQTVETDLTLDTCTSEVRGGPMGEVLTVPRVVRMITTEEWRKRQQEGLQ